MRGTKPSIKKTAPAACVRRSPCSLEKGPQAPSAVVSNLSTPALPINRFPVVCFLAANRPAGPVGIIGDHGGQGPTGSQGEKGEKGDTVSPILPPSPLIPPPLRGDVSAPPQFTNLGRGQFLPPSRRSITFALQGDVGREGQQGAPGVQGVPGESGRTGIPGVEGWTGLRGAAGEPGVRGLQVSLLCSSLEPTCQSTTLQCLENAITLRQPQLCARVLWMARRSRGSHHLGPNFPYPQGQQGLQGAAGQPGQRGNMGPTGEEGPQGPVAQIRPLHHISGLAAKGEVAERIQRRHVALMEEHGSAAKQGIHVLKMGTPGGGFRLTVTGFPSHNIECFLQGEEGMSDTFKGQGEARSAVLSANGGVSYLQVTDRTTGRKDFFKIAPEN